MIRVTDMRAVETRTEIRLCARVRHSLDGEQDTVVWLGYPHEYSGRLAWSADPWIALLLWPAMKLGQDLHVEAPVSPLLLESTQTLMDIMRCWQPAFRPVTVTADGASCDGRAATANASFFSGGVDSFYTAVKHTSLHVPAPSRTTHLISVRGFDVPLANDALWTEVAGHLRDCAAGLGCAWVECSTNVRLTSFGALVPWRMYYGGPLAAVSLGLQGLWKSVLIPGAFSYAELQATGAHPMVDPLWSTESVHIRNDGAEATRMEKIARIAQSDLAMEHLRVCWENRQGRYNCGVCEKCIRTMVGLKIAGVLHKCRTFDRPLSYREIRRVRFTTPAQRALMLQNYRAAQASGADPRLIRALQKCVAPTPVEKARSALLLGVKRVLRNADRLVFDGRIRQWLRPSAS